ncbi:MAG TPA: hypothetical protein VG733_12595, partial [Chthoniobacteraceae bacterium]|nr:hypothetical protein [Chthoniobacteraceae bacterium]
MKRQAALGIFALLVTAAPLLFGSVDWEVQTGLVALFAAGLFFVQPQMPPLSKRERQAAILWAALVVLKEFAPWKLFGAAKWRTMLVQDFGLGFFWTHNPEPGRAVHAMLVIAMGVLWFLWVRTLAADSENR